MKFNLGISLLLVFFLVISTSIFSQNSVESLQKECKTLLSTSLSVGGSIFGKPDYQKAEELLLDANDLIKENQKPEKAVEYLSQAKELFNKSIDVAKIMNPNFPSLMKMREQVLLHGLSENTLKIWKEGEDNFVSAFDEFKDKDNEGVAKYTNLAEKNYKDAETIAIKDQYLLGVKGVLAKAEDEKLEKSAPKTLIKIKQLIADAENILNTNKYDTLAAKKISNTALYEVNHGVYMQNLFTNMIKDDKTWEDLQLYWEEPVAKIVADLKLDIAFDTDIQTISGKVLEKINSERIKLADTQKEVQNLKTDNAQLKKSLDETKTNLLNLQNEHQKLSKELAAATKAKEELQGKVTVLEQENVKFKTDSEITESNQKLIESVSSMFLPSEAEVIKNGELLTLRLVNLNFAQNKSTLESQYFSLLTKVQKVIQTFPKGTVVIEGHTDGVGDYQKNIDLSQARANAVYQYLMSTMGADAARITVVGLGGSKPIANNSSAEGKAKNSRIEVVINPHLDNAK